MSFLIREYRPEDEAEWMHVHAVIMTISHAWNYCIQERPAYEGYESTRLVVEVDGKIVGLTDVQYENEPGELCLVHEPKSGYVLEFGRLPAYAGLGIGKALIDATVADARERGYQRLEYWSQDRAAQRFYRRLKLEEIGRHYRFRFRPPKTITDSLMEQRVGIEYCYGVCLPEDWPLVQQNFDVITRHPLEPHLCVGFHIRTDA